MPRHPLHEQTWYAASTAYYLLHSPAEPAVQEEARRWSQAHARLYDTFVAWVEEAHRLASVALHHAWAPYSRFPVGAALLAADGTLWHGCNLECSSFGLTLCAERVALGNAVAHGRREFVLLALVTDTQTPITPCGACRQVLYDFSPQLLISALGAREQQRALWWLEELLPTPFSGREIWKR